MNMLAVAEPPKSYTGDHCLDCGAPISAYSRGRCVPCSATAKTRPLPEDFMQVLREKGSLGAAAYYHASAVTVTRWRRELDLRPHMRATRRVMTLTKRFSFTERPLLQYRDWSEIGQAVEYLRRWGAVYRCDAKGKPDAKGEFWRRNFSVLTEDEIMHHATRLGWKPVEL